MRPAPPAPRPGSVRGQHHAIQRNDANTGRLVERFFKYPFEFSPLAPGASQTINMRVMSMGSRYIVAPAIRGNLILSTRALNGLEAANLQLRLTLNALDDWISDGQGGNTASLAVLFGSSRSPWFWFTHPHRLRAGDNLLATITNTTSGETAPTLTPELVLRFMDADIYWDLYGKLLDVQEASEEDLMQREVG